MHTTAQDMDQNEDSQLGGDFLPQQKQPRGEGVAVQRKVTRTFTRSGLSSSTTGATR